MWKQLVTPNLFPVVTSNGVVLPSISGWCLAYTQVAFGTPRLYASAWLAWQATKKKHTNRDFPRNVYFPIWFSHYGSYGSPPRYDNWGHVAIALVRDNGTMTIWSSPAGNKTSPDIYSSVDQVANVYRSTYVGWSEDLSNTDLITYQGGATTATTNMISYDEFAQIILDIIEDSPHYKSNQPQAFTGHVNWLQVEHAKDWAAPRKWAKGIMANNGVLNRTYMAEHLAKDRQYQEQAEKEMSQLSKDVIDFKVAKETAEQELQGATVRLNEANNTNAELRASIEQRAQELADKAAKDHSVDLFKTAYLTQTGEYPPAKTIEQWQLTDSPASEWVRAHVANAQVKAVQELLDHANSSIRSLTTDKEDVTAANNELLLEVARKSTEIANLKAQAVQAQSEVVLLQKANENLLNRAETAERNATEVVDWGWTALLTEALKRLLGR